MDILSTSGINNLINNYRYSERFKRINPLEEKKSKFSTLSTTWNNLNTKLNSLKSILSDFKDPDSNTIFNSKTAEINNDVYFSANASSSAALSRYDLFIDQLAKNDIVMSDTVNSSSSHGLSAGTYSFNLSSGDFNQIIEIEIDGLENLEEMMELVASAINNATDGVVNASLFSPTDGNSKLSIVAAESGSSNAISITDESGGLLNTIGLNLTSRTIVSGDSGGYSYSSEELKSKFQLNGINIERDSNVIDNLIDGVTLTLKKEMEIGIPTVNLTVKNNVEATKADIQDLIEKFNDAYLLVKENYKTKEDGTRGVFVGNASAIGLMQSLSSITSNKVDGLSEDDINYLSEIGIEFDTQSGLSISDNNKLEEALKTKPDQVGALFNSDNGIANQLYNIVENYVGADGTISNMVKAYDKSVSYYSDKISFQESRIDKSAMVMRRQYEQLQLQLVSLNEMQSYFNMAGIF